MRLAPASDPAWQIAADRALYWLEPRLPAVIAGTVLGGLVLALVGRALDLRYTLSERSQ